MENQEITFFKGTHRIIPPSKTIENNENKTKIAGITRITEITHLDRIGIPVFSAIRPTAQDGGISIYGGKGITQEHAKASAMMEGFERYSAEKQPSDKTITASLSEIDDKHINPISLNLPKDFSKDKIDLMNLEWNISKDLISGDEYYIPSNAIYHPYVPSNNVQGLFKGNTNGLASGNNLEEAILHGIFEVIERDAWSIFELTHKNSKQIDIESIDNENINYILNKYRENKINIKLMNLTADIDVPTIAASADDTVLKDAGLLSLGIGTHLNPEIAILRALTEVAQSRATQIQGAREDTVRADFARKAGYERMKRINSYYFEDEDYKMSFNDIDDKSTNSINRDIEIVKEELIKNGLDKILYVDLTRPELGVSVVRVVIPTMELYSLDNTRAGDRCLKF